MISIPPRQAHTCADQRAALRAADCHNLGPHNSMRTLPYCLWSAGHPPPAWCESGRRWTLVCQLSSWFNAYCLVRTLSNSIEATCTAAGVCLWMESRAAARRGTVHPVHPLSTRRLRRAALAAAGVGAVMRPSSAAFWLPLGDCDHVPCKPQVSRKSTHLNGKLLRAQQGLRHADIVLRLRCHACNCSARRCG